ncbi:twitchin-like isoform X1 [Crassostrea angulata]|uniref:twitchin-like isoform X1 n=1 Tax=Magallana angulata TaxID=2784310 RepID=UPI0022B11B8A|nr:twitchin-like isoform X1 [Crassostrea angulata]XP_052706903.1 twitchin-like isoform X1 [Crassostrea angulata]XP_052706979.1 twitchin-like isoform X1 [Crassostrea angulata]
MGVGDDIAPRFTQKPVLKQEDNGAKLVFQCTLEASPKPDIQWFQGTTPISQSNRIKMRVEPAGGNKYNVMMDIIGVTAADAGTYKVVAKNKLGEVSASINLNFSGSQKQQDGIAPNFIQKPVTKQADNGKKLLFECQLTADPAPQITWFKDEQQITPGGRIKIRSDPQPNKKFFLVLEISDVNAKDAGNYRVTAKNALGESNATIRLNFDSDESKKQQGQPPKFTTKPMIRQEGDKIIFDCKLTADPKPTITWYKGTEVLKEGGRYKMKMTSDKANHTVSMEIAGGGMQDGGEYKAVAKNSFGESTATITLNFEGKKPPQGKAPHFLTKPTIKQERMQLLMTCNLEGKPEPKLSWFRDNTEITNGGRYTMLVKKDASAPDRYVATLTIKDPKADDGGQYKATAVNELGESNATITLNFQVRHGLAVAMIIGLDKPKGTPPTFKEKPKVNQQDKNLVVECSCNASPKPTLTWYKDSKVLMQGPRYKMRSTDKGNDYTFYLDILNFSAADSGNYKVVAKNDAGEGTATININLEPPKESPPSMKDMPNVRLVDNGKKLVCDMRINSKSRPTTMWYFGNSLLKLGGRYRMDVKEESPGVFLIFLEIANPMDSDSGDYKCIIKNPTGEITTTAKINMKALMPQVKVEPANFSQKLSPKSVTEGEALDLIAKVTGTEPITATWSKDRKPIKDSDGYKISYDKGTCRLYIADAKPADSGEFKVEVKNQFGSAFCSASLGVKAAPKKPEEKKPEEKKPEEKKPEEKKPEKKEEVQQKVETPKAPEKPKEEPKAPEKPKEEPKAPEKPKEEPKAPEKPKEEPKAPEKPKEEPKAPEKPKEQPKAPEKPKEEPKPEAPKIVIDDEEGTPEKNGEYETQGPKRIVVKKKQSAADAPKKLDGPTHKFKGKPSNQSVDEGNDISCKLDIEVQPDAPAPAVKYLRGGRELKNDSRTKITTQGNKSTMMIRRSRFTDEAKYTAILEQDGVQVDEATWSVFVKDPKDSQLDYRNLLKHRDHKKNEKDDEDIDWGSLKPGSNQQNPSLQSKPQSMVDKKGRRPSEIEMMKKQLKKVPGSDSEDEKLRSSSGQAIIYEEEEDRGSRRQSVETLDIPIKKPSVDKLEAIEQNRRSSMQQRRASLVELIPDWPTLQHREVKKEEPDKFLQDLQDMKIKEGTKEAVFSCEFVKPNAKLKWFKNKLEIFNGHKYHFKNEGNIYKLILHNVKLEDGGKYTLECNGVKTSAWLYVEAKEPEYFFTQKLPEKYSVTRRKEAVMECFVSDPRAKVKWYRNGEPIDRKIIRENPDKYTPGKLEIQRRENRCILRIKDARPEDEAEFKCECGAASTTCKLSVTEPEWDFMKLLEDVEGVERDKAVFECDVNDPEAEVTWWRGDKELSGGGKYEIIKDNFKRRLVVKNCHMKDDGEYTCKVLDKSTKASLFVEPDIKFFKKLENKRERETGTLVLECKASNPHNQPVKWFKDGMPINRDDPRLEITRKGEMHKLVITNLNRDDAGQYTCQVGERPTRSDVIVDELPKPPKVDPKYIPEEIVVKKGECIELEIPFVGTPQPVALWKKDGTALSEADTDLQTTDRAAKIRIPDAQRTDTGEYELTLTNEVGTEIIPIPVRVLDRPGRPEGPLDVVDVYSDRCSLLWDRPKDDGGSPIKHYTVEKNDAAKDTWEEVCTTEDLEIDVTGLKEGHRYQFQVKAVNAQGVSDPLVADGEIIAKDPWDPSDPPEKPEIIDYDKDYVEISWKPPKNDGGAPIEKYIIEKKEKGSDKWEKGVEVEGSDTTGTVEGLTEGKEYEFRVLAKNRAGLSQPSSVSPPVVTKARRVKPRIMDKNKLLPIRIKRGQPFNIDISFVGEPAPTVTWKRKTLDLDSDSETELDFKDGKEEEVTPDSNVSIDNSTPKKSKLKYLSGERKDTGEYTVVVANKHGSDDANIEVVVLGPPTKPEGPLVVENVTKDQATLKWKEPKDNGGNPVSGYRVEKKDTQKGRWEPVKDNIKGSEFTVPKLTEGRDYHFRVAAVNDNGESDFLETDSPVTAKNPFDEPFPPSMPKCIEQDRDHIIIGWEPPENDGGNPVQGYIVERKEPKSNRWTPINRGLVKDCQFEDEKVTEGKEYEYRVLAVNEAGNSEPSVPCKPITAKPTKEPPKVNLDALFGAKEIRVKAGEPLTIPIGISGAPTPTCTWNKNGSPVDSRAQCTSTEEDAKLFIPKCERKDTGKYTITVSNAYGTETADIPVVVLDKPGAPEGPLEVSDVMADSCKLSWKPPVDNGGAEVTGYVVEKQEEGSSLWEKVTGIGSGTTMPVKGLKEGKKYKFRVKAENIYGAGEPLETSKPTLAKNPFDSPDAPKNLQIPKYDKRSCDLTWDKPDFDGGNPISGYVVEKRSRGGDWVPVNSFPVKDTNFTVMGLQEGTVVEFRVAAVNDGGPGKFSKATPPHQVRDQVFPAGAPGQPNVEKITKDSVDLSWQKPVKDGGKKPSAYIIEKKSKGGNWEQCKEVSGNELMCTIPNLKEKDEVQFRVIAVNDAGPGEPSRPTSMITVEEQPARPNLNMSNVKDINVKAGQNFQIQVPFSGFPKPTAVWMNGVKEIEDDTRVHLKVAEDHVLLTNTKAERGDAGRYRLTLKNASGQDSGSLNVNVLDRPGSPKGPLTAVDIMGEELTLKWIAPEDNGGEKINNYIVEKRKAGTKKWQKVSSFVNTPECLVKNLEPGTEYEFRVMAENSLGVSDALESSEPVLAKLPYDKPGAPGTPKCSAYTPDSITLEWTPPKKDGGNPIKGYQVEKREAGETKWTKANFADIFDNEFTVKGLTEGKEYEFRVAAINNAGLGEFAETSEAIKAQQPPVAPKVSPNFIPRDITVKKGEEFKIVIPYDGNPIPKADWTVGGRPLSQGGRVSFENTPTEIKLFNKAAEKSDSGKYSVHLSNEKGNDTATINVNVVDSPDKPEGPLEVGNITPDSCVLTWNAPKEDGGSPISNYVVEKMDTRTGAWEPVSKFVRGTNYEVMGLAEGHEYKFRVSAENQFGRSEPLETYLPIVAQHPYTQPDAPGHVSVMDIDESAVTLSWSKPRNDGGKKIVGYVVEYKDPTTGRWKEANDFPIDECVYQVKGLKKDKPYDFRVRAKNMAGLSEPSEVVGPITPKPKYTKSSPPGVPEAVNIGKTYADLKWEPPKHDGGAKITGYVVEKRPKGGETWSRVNDYPCTDPLFTVTNLPENSEWEFRVMAVNAAGNSEPSLCSPSYKIKEKIVGSAPEFIKKPADTKAPLGGEVSFTAEVHGTPFPTCQWYKNGVPVGSGGRMRVIKEDDVFIFVINEIYDKDEGEFTCEISNTLGTEKATCRLLLQNPPKFEKDIKDQKVEVGEQLKIKIPYSGSGPFDVKLKKDNRDVPESNRIKITPFDDYLILVIKDCTADDTGRYQLEASNACGSAKLGFGVNVVSAPSPPTGPLGISDITKNSCRLSWKPPKETGGAKISSYVIERQEVGKPYWVTVSSQCKDTHQDVQGLFENQKYLFRVMAVNEHGQSEPLQAENPIVAKMPFDAPDTPGLPEVTEVGGDFVSLKWDKPKSDGGGRIKSYWVDKREHATENWHRVNLTPCLTNMINIPNLIEDRRYEFRVFAENEAGMSKPSLASNSVKVKDPNAAVVPEISQGLRDIQTVAGKTATFELEVSGNPKPEVQWYKGSREIFDDHKFEIIEEGNRHILIIKDVFGEDADEYSAKVFNRGGSKVSRANLNIRAPPKINVPSRFKEVSTFEKGEPVVIKIPFTGNPKPTVKWVRDGVEIKGRNYVQEVTDRHAILTIKEATKEDDGPYRLTLENELGTDSAVIKIQINDRPDPPRFPVVENIRNDSVVLSWKAPLNDGGSFITGYDIEKCEPPATKWVRVANTRMTFHNIQSLSSGKEYQFRVIAENFYGKSDPCEPTSTIQTEESEASKRKKREDESGRKVRGTYDGPKINDYDKFYEDLWKKYVPQPVQVRTDNIYDYYDILEELGSGAFGVVHRCVEKATGRVFVAKFINTPYPLDKATVKNEINIMNQLHHPKLLQLKDAFEDRHEMILVLEFLSGGELFDRIAAEDYKMTEAEVINYLRQVCEGLKHMHEHSIVHLDVKPENVMCETKKSTNVKMIDFGLATKLNPDEIVKVTTATAEFAAPEIVDSEPIGFYTDMWAVGVLAYVLLSGLSPFAGEDDLETLQNVARCDWEFAEEAFSQVSPEAKDFIRRLLIRRPQERMTVHDCLDHAWLKGDLSSRTTRIPSSRYDKIRARIKERYGDWPQPQPAIGRLANFSSLRKHRPKEYSIYDAYFDRKEAAPRFIRRPRNVLVGEGNIAKFDCRIIAASAPIVTWHFDGGVLTQSVKYMQKYSGSEYELKVSRCKKEDAGTYLVIAENSFGKREEKASLKVEPAPKRDITLSRETTPMRRSRPPSVMREIEKPKEERPDFNFGLRPRLIQAGQEFKLICCVQCTPTPKVTWTKDGRDITHNEHYMCQYSSGVCTMEVQSAQVSDTGTYTCIAVNELGTEETSSYVVVEDRAHEGVDLRKSAKSRSVRQTKSGYSSRYEDSSYNESSYSSSSKTSRSSRKYTEETVEESSYSSRRSDRKKREEPQEVAPEFTQNLSPEILREGDRLKLTCSVKGTPDPDVEWYFNGQLLKSDSHVKIRCIAGSCSLEISEVTVDDDGSYTCKAINSAGVASTKTSVQVTAKPQQKLADPPRFITHPLGLRLNDGDAATLECQISGSPEVKWYKGREQITDSEDFRYENDGDTYRLVIAEVFPEDSGMYKCVAENEAGTASSSFTVFVEVPEEPQSPQFNKFPQSRTVDEGSPFKATCALDDVETVMWTKDGREIEDTGRFNFSQDGNSFTFEIPAALATDSGVYCAKATSSKGKAEWQFTLDVRVSSSPCADIDVLQLIKSMQQ